MSETRITVGLIAKLKAPITEEDWESTMDILYGEESALRISYDGKLAHIVGNCVPEYQFSMQIGNICPKDEFIAECSRFKLFIEEDTIKPYTCRWYDGVDCPIDMLTLEEFENEICG